MLILKKIISNKFIKIEFFVCLFIACFGFISVAKADISTYSISGYHAPSGPGVSFPMWVFISGYKTQPNPQYTASVGSEVTINTEVNYNKTASDLLGGVDYEWYQKFPNKKWELITPKNKYKNAQLNTNSYTFSSNEPKTYYFQGYARVHPYEFKPLNITTYPMPLLNPKLYTNVTAVTFTTAKKSTNDFSISFDSDYLVVNEDIDIQTTYAHINTKEEGTTDLGNIEWETDTPNLISINKKTGLISTNSENLTGRAHVVGRLKNEDGKIIERDAYLTVGNMLSISNDKYEYASGDKTVLTLHGNYQKAKSVIWYKSKDENKKIIANQNNTYQLNPLSKSDNDSTYYVKIQIKNPITGEIKEFESNKITIYVDNNLHIKPSLLIQHTLYSDYKDIKDTDIHLNKVTDGDRLTHLLVIHGDSLSDQNFNHNHLHYPLSPHETLDTGHKNPVDINGNASYSISLVDGHEVVYINNIDIFGKLSFIYIHTKVINTKNDTFVYDPSLTIDLGNDSQYTFYIRSAKADFISNDISLVSNTNLDFGNVAKIPGLLNKRKAPVEQAPIITIYDDRRKKTPYTLTLDFQNKFHENRESTSSETNIDGTGNEEKTINNLELRYFNAYQNELGIKTKQINITPIKVDDHISAVSWTKDEGLMLFINDPNFPDGKYKTTVTWTATWSI